MPASFLTELERYLEKLQGIREGLVADPSILLLIVLSLTCAIEFLSNFKPIILKHASRKWLLTACLFLFFENRSLSCRSAVQLQL